MKLAVDYLQQIQQRSGPRDRRSFWLKEAADLIGVTFKDVQRCSWGVKTEWLQGFYEAARARKVDGGDPKKYYFWLLKESRLKKV